MNKENIFDDITRITARAGVDISRRKALSWIVGTLAYGTLGGIGLGRKALAVPGEGSCITSPVLLGGPMCNNLDEISCFSINGTLISGTNCCIEGTKNINTFTTSTPQLGGCTINGVCTKGIQDPYKCTQCNQGATWITGGLTGGFSAGTIFFISGCGFKNITITSKNKCN